MLYISTTGDRNMANGTRVGSNLQCMQQYSLPLLCLSDKCYWMQNHSCSICISPELLPTMFAMPYQPIDKLDRLGYPSKSTNGSSGEIGLPSSLLAALSSVHELGQLQKSCGSVSTCKLVGRHSSTACAYSVKSQFWPYCLLSMLGTHRSVSS